MTTANKPGEKHGEQVHCKRNRILVVDDEIRKLFRQLIALELPHCKLDVAVNGAEAIEIFRHVHHGLIIMDVRMSVMDGETAFTEIEKLCAEKNWEMPAVLFCTGFDASPKVSSIIAKNPRHGLVCKPVPNDELLEAIKARLDKPSA